MTAAGSSSRSTLHKLPAQCVRALAPFERAALEDWAAESGQRFVDIDLAAAADKKAVLRAIGRALSFPRCYGANLDALYDCLTDLPERDETAGWLILLRGLRETGDFDAEQRSALLDVFRDAGEVFAEAGRTWRVFHAP